jgi:hypothetical protein
MASSICRSTVGPGKLIFRLDTTQSQSVTNIDLRICLGQQFALTKAAYVTVRLLQRFDKLDGSSVPPVPIKWAVTLTGKPKDGVKLRLHAAPED